MFLLNLKFFGMTSKCAGLWCSQYFKSIHKHQTPEWSLVVAVFELFFCYLHYSMHWCKCQNEGLMHFRCWRALSLKSCLRLYHVDRYGVDLDSTPSDLADALLRMTKEAIRSPEGASSNIISTEAEVRRRWKACFHYLRIAWIVQSLSPE